MRVLGINSSPRNGGNTDILLDKLLESAKTSGAETEKIVLNDVRFAPCQECSDARDNGVCIVNDGMQDIFKKIEEADALVFATPIFFGSVSAQAKMMIDRFQCLWKAKYVHRTVSVSPQKKNGMFIAVSAANRTDFFDNARSVTKNLFATIGVKYKYELFCPGVDAKMDILKHPDYMRKAEIFGKKLATDKQG